MKRVILYAVTAGMMWCNYACNKEEADNRFSSKMFRKVSELSGANTFFSPLSLNLALGMLYNGSSSETRII